MCTLIKVGALDVPGRLLQTSQDPGIMFPHCFIMEGSRRQGKEGVFLSSKSKVSLSTFCGISSVSCTPGSSIFCYVVHVSDGGVLELVPGGICAFQHWDLKTMGAERCNGIFKGF